MASSPWAESSAAASVASLTSALALAASMVRRIPPQTSGSQLAPMLARYWVRAPPPPDTTVPPPPEMIVPLLPVPPPERVPLPVSETVGKRLAWSSRTTARA